MKRERAKITVRGAVQGVGFRPFIFRLAHELRLSGRVNNSTAGVMVEIEGERAYLNEFLIRLEKEKPPRAMIQSLEFSFLEAVGYDGFNIHESTISGAKTALILPDIAPCADCVCEMFDPQNRRHLYPFTNCTRCGPRFSIIESLPYDRANTSMKTFVMCPDCLTEYRDPHNRRFHAQPNACPTCGPRLEIWDRNGKVQAEEHQAVLLAAAKIREGRIVALKSIGGFQLLVNARHEQPIQQLRQNKNREAKPFAVVFPDLVTVKAHCHMDKFEERLLISAEAPIVLLKKKPKSSVVGIADTVAPGNPYLGAMLPCSPLHHILMRELNFPVVATSGNPGAEPLCTDERQAVERLNGIADFFLVHNRPIVRQVDDSVARIIFGREQILRRARGYAPLPLTLNDMPVSEPVLAVGAHLKNSIALAGGEQVFVSQHIGDLETEPAYAAFRNIIADFKTLYEISPEHVVCDLHPDYLSTKFAHRLGIPVISIQHHHAHVLSCATENQIQPPLLGVAWDGTGLGIDGKIWGGEFLLLDDNSFHRVAHFREFPLPGNDAAVKQPRRAALGLLWEIFGDDIFNGKTPFVGQNFSETECSMLRRVLGRKINCSYTTSAGRLFDAAASIFGLRQRNSFEGHAAMELEAGIETGCEESYLLKYAEANHKLGPLLIDWEPMVLAMFADMAAGEQVGRMAARFHNAMAGAIVEIARRIGQSKVALSGGCFQNRYLLERAITGLEKAGFKPYWHQQIPTNDGGVCFGQAVAGIKAVKSARFNSDESRPVSTS